MTKKKKEKGKGKQREEKGLISLETVNCFRRAGGMTLLETLPPYLIPAPAPAPSLVSPSPNEGAPLEKRPKSAPLERSPTTASLEKPSLEKMDATPKRHLRRRLSLTRRFAIQMNIATRN
jgi:hypothetical protein